MRIVYYKLDDKKNIQKEIKEVDKSLDTYYELIDGYIEVYPLTDKLLVVLDEEGKLKQKEPRAVVLSLVTKHPEVIAGDFFICRKEKEDFASIQDEDMDLIDSLVITDLK